jgi:hypothetical protein
MKQSILHEGCLVFLYRDQLEPFLQEYTSEVPRPLIRKIAETCFSKGAHAVLIFLDKPEGTYVCRCYMPIYQSRESLEKSGCVYGDIGGCGYIDASVVVEPLWDLRKEKLFAIADLATRNGYWAGGYAIITLDEDTKKCKRFIILIFQI